LSAVLQRFISGGSSAETDSGVGGILSEDEKKQLLSNVKKEIKTIKGEEGEINLNLTKIKDKFTSDGSQ